MGISATQKPLLVESDKIYSGTTQEPQDLQELASQIVPGSVVIISELHGFAPHHDKQVELLKAIETAHPQTVSVGMEFLEYPEQDLINDYLGGRLDEETFLKEVQWGLPEFPFYRRQARFPLETGGNTVGLNAPRSLSGKIAKEGLESLTEYEKDLLPPHFELGSAEYLERFREIMGGHVDEKDLVKYFAAQSLWDDTMAWIALQYMKFNPNRTLVIIVGDFHNAYKLGLPNRLKARGVRNLITISQVDLTGLSDKAAQEEITPHPSWGERADFVWTSKDSEETSKKEPLIGLQDNLRTHYLYRASRWEKTLRMALPIF